MTVPVAAIDAGTNTFRLLITDLVGGVRQPLCKKQVMVRLGGNYVPADGLDMASMRRAIVILKDFAGLIDRCAPSRVRAVTTSIVREAINGQWFIDYVRRETGLELEIISGIQEALLTVQGVLNAVPLAGQSVLIFDIGGGSTEFSLVEAEGSVGFSRCYPFGVVKLTEKYIVSGNQLSDIRQNMIEEIDSYLDDLLRDMKKYGSYPPAAGVILVGTAGTMTTFAAIEQQLEVYDSSRINGFSLNSSRLEAHNAMLWEMDPAQRQQVRGLEPGREDVILAGGEVALRIMKRLNFDQVIVSDDGLLEGVALSLLAERV